MLTRTKRYIIPSGSFDSILNNLENINSGNLYNASAVTSSCNWDGRVWCDITFTCDPNSSFDAHMTSAILITKQVSDGVFAASGSLPEPHDIQFI